MNRVVRWPALPAIVGILSLTTLLAGAATHVVVRQSFLDNMDERNYLWLADRLLEGRVTAEAVPSHIRQHFEVMWRAEHNGRQYTVFPVGWPALLALGRAIGIPWVVNPVLAAVCVLLTYALTSSLYGDSRVSWRAVYLLALTPLLIFQAGTMLSHVATSFWLLAGLLALLQATKRDSHLLAIPAGLALGLAASTRPLDAFAVAVPAGVAFAICHRNRLGSLVLRTTVLTASGLVGLIPFFAYNRAVTGSALLTPQQLYGFPESLLASSLGEWLNATLPRTVLQLSHWQIWFLPMIIVALSYCVLAGSRFDGRDLLSFGFVLVFLAAYSLNVAYYDIAGPRYHLFAIFPSCVLLARASRFLAGRQATLAFATICISYLTTYVYQGSQMYRDLANKRSLELSVGDAGLKRAIIFIPDGWHFGMSTVDQVNNEPDFSGVIYARDIPATNGEVMAHFPGVPAYRWPSGDSRPPGRLTVFSGRGQ